MGNENGKTLSSCCTNDSTQNKKEVDIGSDKAEMKRGAQDYKTVSSPNRNYDLPLQRPDSSNYNSQAQDKSNSPAKKEAERLRALEQALDKASTLVLKIINSTTLPKGTTLVITPQGLQDSLRGKKDGIVYFGCKKKSKPLNENFESSEVLNDFIIRNKDPETNDRHRGRHFQIEYNIDQNNYTIRDLGIGFGAFVKIDHPLIIRDNNLLSMGSSFLIINLDDDDQQQKQGEQKLPKAPQYLLVSNGDETKIRRYQEQRQMNKSYSEITVKIFGGPSYGEVYHFNSNQTIKIGRMPECEIKIEDNLLSKYQATIQFVPGSGWTLFDGHSNKPSTNSNWLYLNDDYELTPGMVFKANHTLFQVREHQKKVVSLENNQNIH